MIASLAKGCDVDLTAILVHGAAAVRHNDSADQLRGCAEALVRASAEYDGFGVVPASPQAERVLGAAMMLAPTMHGTSSGPSIVFDVNFASGTLLARTARKLRDSGNDSRLIGLVLNPLIATAEEIRIADLERVEVVPRPFDLRQQSQGCVSRVAVPTSS